MCIFKILQQQTIINYKSQRKNEKCLQYKWLVSLKCKEHLQISNHTNQNYN